MKQTYSVRMADGLVVMLVLVFAFYLRYLFRYFQSGDFVLYTNVWYITVQSLGFSATGTDVSNYTPAYLYILFLISRLFPDLTPVVAIKVPSVFCDFLCAILVLLIVRLKYPAGREPLFAFLAVMLAPTVIINSSLWGQADSIYTSVLLACVYCLMTGRIHLAVLAFGVALSLKLQAIFLAPALLGLWLRSRAPWWSLFIVPATYAAIMLPAWLAGRPASELAMVYLSQAGKYQSLSMNAPNLYVWLPDTHYKMLVMLGLSLAATIAALYIWWIWKSKIDFTRPAILRLCLLSLIVMPFILPKMHDRFFYPADVLAIAYGFVYPKHYFVPVFVGFASFFAYQPFLARQAAIPLTVLSLIICIALVLVARSTWRGDDCTDA